MEVLFNGKPNGTVDFLTLSDALKRINQSEKRIEDLVASPKK
jgi:hypothetical protein